MTDAAPEARPAAAEGTPAEVFGAFLRLGLTSFGGPVAHLGYFREALVVRRGWLSEARYAEIVALCQFLPGPASSQVGLALGLLRAGPLGALAAWTAFTLPSALALALFAAGLSLFGGAEGAGWLTGLKAAAVAVVAQACLGMGRNLAPDAPRLTLAVAAAAAALLIPGAAGQLGAIALGAVAGLRVLGGAAAAGPGEGEGIAVPLSRRTGAVCLALFAVLLAGLPLLAGLGAFAAYAEGFYRAGALVFGGGHVVLPLLESSAVGGGWVDADAFIAGYGAAQAVPGPLFTFAAFLGQVAGGPLAAVVSLIAIFLPGALLVLGTLPFWDALRGRRQVRAALAGVNAAVVGVLLAALYDPVFLRGAAEPAGFVIAAAAFLALATWKRSPVEVVLGSAALGAFAAAAGLL